MEGIIELKLLGYIMTIETIFIAIGAALVEVILKPIQRAIMPYIKKRIEDGFRKNQKGVYERKVAIASLLKLIEDQEGIVKAVQIQTKNGGGVPKANTPIYGSIVSPAKYSDTFRSQLLDSQYCDLVSNLITTKRLTFVTRDLPDCILKDQLLTQGVRASIFFDASITKSDYNFIAVDLNVLPTDLPPEVRDSIRQYTNELIKLLKK